MKRKELMDLDIQLFAKPADNEAVEENTEDTATEVADGENEFEFDDNENTEEENEDISLEEEEVDNEDETSLEDITKTQIFAKRLREEKEKILNQAIEEKNSFARARGFKDWEDLQKASEEEQLLKMGVEDKEAFENFLNEKISNNPIVLQAKQVIETKEQEEINKFLNNEIEEISKIDPTIKSLDDLAEIPEYDAVMDKAINRGYSLSDAYKVVAFSRIQTNATKNGRQSAIDNINSKNHMKTTSGNGVDDVTVPLDVMASYKKNMPEMTEEQIRKDYSKFLKGGN